MRTVQAANSGDARSQREMAMFHGASAMRFEILQGATPADDAVVAARWADALRFSESAAERGDTDAQVKL
jgi:hypothetical protein